MTSTPFELNLDGLLSDPVVRLVMRADKVDAVELAARFKALGRRLEEKERGVLRLAGAAQRSARQRAASYLCRDWSESGDRRLGACGGA